MIGGKRDDAIVPLSSVVDHVRGVIEGTSRASTVSSASGAGAAADSTSARKEEEGAYLLCLPPCPPPANA